MNKETKIFHILPFNKCDESRFEMIHKRKTDEVRWVEVKMTGNCATVHGEILNGTNEEKKRLRNTLQHSSVEHRLHLV